MVRLRFTKKYLKEQPQFWKKVFWTDETKMNFYQSDGKSKVWRRWGTAQEPMHTTSSVKHSGEGVQAWACMAAEDTGSLLFTDDITADGSRKMYSEVYGHILSAQVQVNTSKLIGQWFILQQDDDPKHTANASPEKTPSNCWCPLIAVFELSLHAMDMQQNTKHD